MERFEIHRVCWNNFFFLVKDTRCSFFFLKINYFSILISTTIININDEHQPHRVSLVKFLAPEYMPREQRHIYKWIIDT